jgi:C-terminal processing protease CtpA/Prc
VLTSRETFSGAGEFAYDLQQQKRATIVGEVIGGGAHPGRIKYSVDHSGNQFRLFIPGGG